MSRIKHEELVPLADMVLASFTRDKAEIEAENSTFNAQYLADFVLMTDEVRDLEQSDDLLITQKGITKLLYNTANGLKKEVKLFQIVIKKAALDTKIGTSLLKNIRTRNIEGALVNLKSIGQIITTNTTLLTSKGMKSSFPATVAEGFEKLTDLSNQQSQIMKDRKLLTDENHGSYNALQNYINEVCEIGKTLYDGEVKADEYNISKLLTKLHVSHPKNGEGGETPTA